MQERSDSEAASPAQSDQQPIGEDGRARNCTSVAARIETNDFAYRYDARFRRKHQIPNDALRWQWRGRALNMVMPTGAADETAGRPVSLATGDSYT